MKQDNLSVNDELNSISPLLGGLLRRDAKTVPEGYFNALEKEILSKTIQADEKPEDEIREIAPALLPYLRKDGRKIPPDYFKKLEKEIVSQTSEHGKKKTPVITFVKYFSAAAAVFAVVYFGVKVMSKPEQTKILSFEQQIAQLSKEEISTLIEKNISEFDTQLFFEDGLISDSTAAKKILSEVHQPILSGSESKTENDKKELLDKKLLENMSDSDIIDMLNDEKLMDDFAL